MVYLGFGIFHWVWSSGMPLIIYTPPHCWYVYGLLCSHGGNDITLTHCICLNWYYWYPPRICTMQHNRLWTPNRGSFLYGLIAGLLPVVALAVLTALVPIVIRLVAVKWETRPDQTVQPNKPTNLCSYHIKQCSCTVIKDRRRIFMLRKEIMWFVKWYGVCNLQ